MDLDSLTQPTKSCPDCDGGGKVATVTNPDKALYDQELPAEMALDYLKENEALAEQGLPLNSVSIIYDCPTCDGVGRYTFSDRQPVRLDGSSIASPYRADGTLVGRYGGFG